MKKSIKRLLVLTQVLGWSALVATACTDNDKTVSKTADASKDNTKTKPTNNKTTGNEGDSGHTASEAQAGKTTTGDGHEKSMN